MTLDLESGVVLDLESGVDIDLESGTETVDVSTTGLLVVNASALTTARKDVTTSGCLRMSLQLQSLVGFDRSTTGQLVVTAVTLIRPSETLSAGYVCSVWNNAVREVHTNTPVGVG